jgi:DNA-binding NtrC family response regulator
MAVVLVVEDEEQIRVLAEGVLQGAGHTTLCARTPEEALALLDGDNRFDALFVDIVLQEDVHAGLTMAQEAVKRVPKLGVLYTTGQGLTDGMQAMFVEKNGFISKPYTAEQLMIAVDNLLH